jgi:hypothetical protein
VASKGADGKKKNRHRLKRHLLLMKGTAFLAAVNLDQVLERIQQPKGD